jgi:hypothetical protein
MKKIVFYIVLFAPVTLIAVPLIYIVIISLLTYASLHYPKMNAGYNKPWIHIARYIYYSYDANIWQNQDDCIEYDELLLYRPSTGCFFSNPEFSTKLTFSQEGRTWDNRVKLESQGPVFVLGDSLSMGWGVNDDKTFSYLMEKRFSIPFYNLSVASYGTVREILRAIRHPEFKNARYIILQYHSNDLRENDTFLINGALPPPSYEAFENRLKRKRERLNVLQVVKETFNYIQRHRWSFFGSPVGDWISQVVEFVRDTLSPDTSTDHEGGEDEVETSAVAAPREKGPLAVHADVFLKVIGRFPELNAKKIFVWGENRRFSTYLSENMELPSNVIPIDVRGGGKGYLYPIDEHHNPRGHRRLAKTMIKALKKHGAL